jgi:branched-subunit amino acid aminotransferase/4-amino-4-deoxychorismate lyase
MPILPTPDPARGLFETLLVVDGEPVELGAHLERLGSSLETLFGVEPPPGLEEEIGEHARRLRLGRMRITVRRGDAGTWAALAAEDVAAADVFPTWEHGADLRSACFDGGLGEHKWADRGPLSGLVSDGVPLLLDCGYEVLEASRANVFAVVGDVLATPSADGRILPGIARAGAIAAAHEAGVEVVERQLDRDELLAADEVFLTGSVRGVEPARSLDGAALPAVTDLSRRVGERLRRRWLGAPVAAAAPAPATVPPPGPLAR